MPLSFCSIGESFTIKRLNGEPAIRQHLSELGFCVGEQVCVLSSLYGGLIVKVKESRIAIDRNLANRIMV